LKDAPGLHSFYGGKIETAIKCRVRDWNDFAIWYTPGVSAPCLEIEADPEKQPTMWDAYRSLNGMITISTDKKSGLTTISMEREDPKQAASLLNLLVETFNSHLKEQAIREAEANIAYMTRQIEGTPLLEMRQTLYTVIAEQTKQIMLAKAQPYFAFKIIDPPEVPDKKFKPKRSIMVILSILVAGFVSVFFVFFLEYIAKQRAVKPV